MQKILITGAAGFVGFHLSRRLCESGRQVLGLDNLNDYYDVSLKQARLAILKDSPNFRFEKAAVEDADAIARLAQEFNPDVIIHLAAQAGIGYSLENPRAYINSNLVGFFNVMEAAKKCGVKNFIFASSSSVYGDSGNEVLNVDDQTDSPLNLYAATKKSNEVMAHSYAHLFGIPTTGLRFFTVYGPWGRPDMAYFKFTKALYEGAPITLYNNGRMKRDFTYIDDVIEGVMRVIDKPTPYALYNIGNHTPVELIDMVSILEAETGRNAVIENLPAPASDVPSTCANVDALKDAVGFAPATSLQNGLHEFVNWYRDYYRQ